MSATPVFVGTPNVGLAQIVNADASAQKTLITAGASGTKVSAVLACSDDTSARVIQLSILRSAVNYVIGSVNVPIASGTDGTAVAVDLLAIAMLPGLPTDNDGQKYILLKSGDSLQAKALTSITAAKTMHLAAIGGDL